MASWVDFLSLAATLAVIGGVIYGITYVVQGTKNFFASTKETLKNKGLNVSHTGISVKTSRRFEHEAYMEATQRGIVRVMGASSFGKAENTATNSLEPDDEKKKGILRRK